MLGIVQGRLVPPVKGRIQAFPRDQWADEFPKANAVGLEAIEWIYDAHGQGANPLETNQGIERTRELSCAHHVAINSICADYFMDFPLIRATDVERAERLERLDWLLGQAQRVGAARVVLPFVDRSAIRDEADRDAVVDALHRALPSARQHGVDLALELSLPPDDVAELLTRVPDPLVMVNYDSGNSSSLGFSPTEEFAAYGSRVGSVHVKDRVRGGGTVPLGEGDADFDALFGCLRRVCYQGDFILQVARTDAVDEVEWARHNLRVLKRYLDRQA
jgi:hexulose-6-phosphate isomerase